jgi:hypothetical protein
MLDPTLDPHWTFRHDIFGLHLLIFNNNVILPSCSIVVQAMETIYLPALLVKALGMNFLLSGLQ